MRFWGWLPHLYPSFEAKFEPLLFVKVIRSLDQFKIRSNDKNSDEESTIKIDITEKFSYNTTTFPMSITIGDKTISSDVTVYDSGMVCFDLPSYQGENIDDKEEKVM